MSGWAIFGAILLSLTGLGYLAWTDPKRRRTHGLGKVERRPFFWPAGIATFGPGICLAATNHWSGLAIWAGAVATLGWIMAAITPETYAKLRADMRAQRARVWAKAQQLFQHLSTMPARYVPDRLRTWRVSLPPLRRAHTSTAQPAEVGALKARITALEARLHRLEHQKRYGNGRYRRPLRCEAAKRCARWINLSISRCLGANQTGCSLAKAGNPALSATRLCVCLDYCKTIAMGVSWRRQALRML